jgi:hypothetical protein
MGKNRGRTAGHEPGCTASPGRFDEEFAAYSSPPIGLKPAYACLLSSSGSDKSCGNALRLRDRCPDNDAIRSEVERSPKIGWTVHASLQNHRHRTLCNQGCQKLPCDADEAFGGRSITRQRSRNSIGSRIDRTYRLVKGRDIGQHRQTELIFDSPHNLRPGLTNGTVSMRTIHRDDRGPCCGDGLRTRKVRRDEDSTSFVPFFQADDGPCRQPSESADVFDSLGAKSTCSGEQDAFRDPAERDRVVKRIALRRLTGDNQAVTQFFREWQADVILYANLVMGTTALRL